MNRRTLLTALAAGVALGPLAMPQPAVAQIPVTDAAANVSLTQSLLNQARSLYNEAQSLAHEVTSLTNQATQIAQEAQQLVQFPISVINEIQTDVQRVTGIIQQAQGLGYQAEQLQQIFGHDYPQAFSDMSLRELMATTQRWNSNIRSTLQSTMTLENQVTGLVPNAAARVERLANAPVSGTTSAVQQLSQITATVSDQLGDLTTLLVAQGRAAEATAAAQAARQAAAEDMGRRVSETIDSSPWTHPPTRSAFGIQ